MYMQRTTSAAAGNGLYTIIKYMLGAAGISLGTTIKYLRRTTSAGELDGNLRIGLASLSRESAYSSALG